MLILICLTIQIIISTNFHTPRGNIESNDTPIIVIHFTSFLSITLNIILPIFGDKMDSNVHQSPNNT